MAACAAGQPSRSMATRKSGGSGLPIATGSAPPATAIACGQRTAAGVELAGPDREACDPG